MHTAGLLAASAVTSVNAMRACLVRCKVRLAARSADAWASE
jgi:hypothetical protein